MFEGMPPDGIPPQESQAHPSLEEQSLMGPPADQPGQKSGASGDSDQVVLIARPVDQQQPAPTPEEMFTGMSLDGDLTGTGTAAQPGQGQWPGQAQQPGYQQQPGFPPQQERSAMDELASQTTDTESMTQILELGKRKSKRLKYIIWAAVIGIIANIILGILLWPNWREIKAWLIENFG
jgi:hypothetical protein